MADTDVMLGAAKHLVAVLDKAADRMLPKEIADIVKFHSKGAGVAGIAAGWAPGVGSTLAVATAAGFVWTMYGRINAKLDVPIGKNVLKSLASALCTNLAAYMAATFVGSTLASLFPGIGSVAAAGINGAMVFALTWVSGLVYLKLLAVLAKKKVSFDSVSADEIKSVMKEVVAGENVKSLLKEAKNIFTRQKESGELDGVNAADWTETESGEEAGTDLEQESMGTEDAEATAVHEETIRRPKFCSECGAKVSQGKFCTECGAKLV